MDTVQGHSTKPQLARPTESTTRGNDLANIQGRTVTMEEADISQGNNPVTDASATTCGNKTDENKSPETLLPSAMTDLSCELPSQTPASKYYDIPTLGEENIISISHDDIISNKCEVSLKKLSNSDLEEIRATLCNKCEDNSSTTSSGDEKPVKKVSLCPCKHPSTARMRAKRLINARNAKIR